MDKNISLRPVPRLLNDPIFLSKKARSSTPYKRKVPPRPPSKSLSSISRFFPHSPRLTKAQAVSFIQGDDSSLSKSYDETQEGSYFQQCFTIERKIGSGSFGDVFKCISKEDGRYYAIKKSREKYKGKSDRERRLQEVAKHEQLTSHSNIVRFYKAWEENYHLYIQMELCECSLSEFTENNHDIPENMVWDFIVDMLSAIKHLHSRDLIHLDIKAENIFISSNGSYKLGDFGLMVRESEIDINEVTEGDPKYLAKELMQGIFTKAADLFSLGITTLEFACDLELPSRGEGWHQLREGRMPEMFFNKLSAELREVILWMMHSDYRKRCTAEELLSHSKIKWIYKKRMVMSKLHNTARLISDFLRPLITYLFKIFFICYFYNLIKNKLSEHVNDGSITPPSSRISAKDWDQSFSDDEMHTNSLLLSSISDEFNLSSSSDNLNLLSRNIFFHSTTNRHIMENHSQRRLFNDSMSYSPMRTPMRKNVSTFDNISSTSKNSSFNTSFSFNERASFCDLSDDEDDNVSINPIRPKNLLNIFDQMETQETKDNQI